MNRRDFLKTLGYTAGATLLNGCSLPLFGPQFPDLPAQRRQIWVWSDSHIGRMVDGKDGGEWAGLSVRDLLANVGTPDYALVLGDITHGGKLEAFQTYATLRNQSGIARWYELVGNHDYKGIETGLYPKYVRPEERYVLCDGNLVWIFLSAERGRAAGILNEPTRAWLPKVLAKHQDKNIVVCSHQVIAHTVRYSDPQADFETVLHPTDWIAELLKTYRVDLWLCGHEHGPKRDRNQIRRVGHTTFINIASLSHLYGTQACNSFVLEMTAGDKEIAARCRHHDREQYIERFSVRVPLPRPLTFASQPRIIDVHRKA